MTESDRLQPLEVVCGWLWAYSAVRKAFDKADVEAVAWELIVRLKHAGYEIEGAACYDGSA